jgi:hypothetical protein
MQLLARLFEMADNFFCLFLAVDTLRVLPRILARSVVSRLQTILCINQSLILLAVSTSIEASLEVL